MKKFRIILVELLVIILLFGSRVNATTDGNIDIKEVEYTQEYKEWLELPEEEKAKILEPNKYSIEHIESEEDNYNPFRKENLLGSSAYTDKRFSLKDIISENTKIRDQGETSLCWAFSTLGVLETNLALQDYYNQVGVKEYDFSEAHLAYATTRNAFLNDQVNEKGLAKNVDSFGNFYMAQNYLTNGMGAVNESNLSLDNIPNNIDISNIQNNSVQTTLYDTVEFKAYANDENNQNLKKELKEHILKHGGIYAGIYGDDVMNSEYYNNTTGALYVDNSSVKPDHAIVIIGWDDDYSIENFNSNHRPQNNGAWIVKNSWGEELTTTLDKQKQQNYEYNKAAYNEMGVYDYQSLPDEYFIQTLTELGYTYDESTKTFSYKIGDNGYMYISYEDVNVYLSLWGVEKAANTKDYTNIYMNDLLGPVNAVGVTTNGAIYISNVFNRENVNNESLTKISLYTYQDYKDCKVFVNPNGNDKSKNNLVEVQLKDSNDISAGFHTLEFAEPIELTGTSFVVVLKCGVESGNSIVIATENKSSGYCENAIINENESFVASEDEFENNEWVDLATLDKENLRGNITLRAYTKVNSDENVSLSNLEVSKQPTKTTYNVGENFDKTGMEVTAVYSDNSRKIVSSYIIVDGENLTENKTSVTISYTENGITKTVTQPITVSVSGEETKENKNPKSSDFLAATATITQFIDGDKISVNISNIKIGDQDDTYTYYVALAANKSISDVKDEYWIPVSSNNVQRGNDGIVTISLDIPFSDIKNISDLTNAKNLYINIKEIAEINDKKIETINVLELGAKDSSDAVKTTQVSSSTAASSTIDNSNSNTTKDDTVATKILPKTGKGNIIISVLLIIGIGCFSYSRYRNIDK